MAEAPVPGHLYEVLNRTPPRVRPSAGKSAAVAALTVVAAFAGWWVGQSDTPSDWPPTYFLEGDQFARLDRQPGVAPHRVADLGAAAPMNWLSERISLSLRVPDLSERGYTVTRKETVHVANDRLVRLNYRSAEGHDFNLYLRPWWDNRSPDIRFVRRDDTWLAHWRDGPLASVLSARLPRAEVERLAREIRRDLHERNRSAPKMKVDPPMAHLPGLADSARSTHPDALPAGPADIRPQRKKAIGVNRQN
jgi:anti-sigma factor RsiW